MDKEFCILKISDSPLFKGKENDINIERYQHDIEKYKDILETAIQKGIAVIIEGSEPNDKELIEIKNVLEKMGIVKVFRKRKKIKEKNMSIKPSIFHTVSVCKIEEKEAEEIKNKTYDYIKNLIDNN
jgi:hypothetical protein